MVDVEAVKQKNKSVYTREGNNISAVAVPTTAMQEGGTEYRLILAVGSLLALFSSPAIFFAYNAVQALKLGEDGEVRLAANALGFVLFFFPMFVFSRYAGGVLAAMFMTLRMLALPLLVAMSSNWFSLEFVLVLYACELVLLAVRQACRNSQASKEGKLRIMLISDALPPKVDGVATFAQHMIKYFTQRGHELCIVTSILGEEKMCGVPVTRLPGMSTKISPGHTITLPLFHLVLREVIRFKPDVIHMFEVSPLNLANFYFCHILDIPCTFSHHTRLDLYINIVTPLLPTWVNEQILKTLEWAFFPLPDGHLCVSKVLFNKVKNRGAKEPRPWSSGVDEKFDRKKYSPEKRTYMSGGNPELPLVCHVGRLGPEKNSDELPNIMKETWKLLQGKVRFVVIGDGILRPQIEQEVTSHGIRCEFMGILRGEALESSYASCDVFFSPSTTEGFPLVFLEAMRSGLAVVGPVAGGVPDAYEAGKEGELFEPHDAKDAARAIKRAIDAGRDMRDCAEATGVAYSWERVNLEMEDLLQLVVRKKQQSGWMGALFNKQEKVLKE